MGCRYSAALNEAEAKVRAEWKAGRMLRGVDGQQGARTDLTSSQDGDKLAILDKAGLPSVIAYRWQIMSWLP